MKKLTKIFACAALVALAAHESRAQSVDGQGGNGGAGVQRNGLYMTFYSAGFYIEPNEATSDEVPQLDQLLHFFNTTPYMSDLTKVKYTSQLIPSSVRKYYKVQPNTFTPEIRARLIAEYGRVMNIDTNTVALFAITDTTKKTTYLFPEFYSLKATEQQAILFHEAYWLVNPTSTYQRVIQAEMSFQALIEGPISGERLLRWLRTAGSPGDVLVAAIRSDLQTGALKGLARGETIKTVDLLGEPFFDCRSRGIRSECTAFITTHAYALTLKYPKSLFLKLFYDSTVRNELHIGIYSEDINSDENFLNGSRSNSHRISGIRRTSVKLNSSNYTGSTTLTTTYGPETKNFDPSHLIIVFN